MDPNDMIYVSTSSLLTKPNEKTQPQFRPCGATPPTPPTSTSSNMLLFSKYQARSPYSHHQHLPPEIHYRSQRSPMSIEENVDVKNDLEEDVEVKKDMEEDVEAKSEIDDGSNNAKRNMSSEKKRQRRESHNIVEQRRRDNISARIKELSELLPPPSSPHPQQKFNRGVVLQKSVEHIRLLQQLVLQQQEHIRELEALLEGTHHPTVLSGEHQPSSSSPSSSIAVYTGTTYTEAQ